MNLCQRCGKSPAAYFRTNTYARPSDYCLKCQDRNTREATLVWCALIMFWILLLLSLNF